MSSRGGFSRGGPPSTLATVIVIAKECVPGKVKTRLHPPLSLEQAAGLAQASLDDTLRVVAGLPSARRVLFIQGRAPSSAQRLGFHLEPQPAGSLDERLAAIFDRVDGPALLVGMDTPQLTAAHLAAPIEDWDDGDPDDPTDAWYGPATDGGFWALGLRNPTGDAVRGVPMSRDDTGARQLERLEALGLRVRMLPALRDVDLAADAAAVAELAPSGRFGAAWRTIAATLNPLDPEHGALSSGRSAPNAGSDIAPGEAAR